MTPTTFLFLPSGDRGLRWLRVADDASIAEGEGMPDAAGPTLAVVPAEAVTLHWADLPGRSTAQATAAARIVAGEASAAPIGELHVAIGEAAAVGQKAGDRPIGVVGLDAMRGWLALLAKLGVDPVALVPAPMLLPAPADGYARAEIAGEGLIRGRSAGFADEARLTELVTRGIAPVTLGRGAIVEALQAAAASPALDLRQGVFARRRRYAIDWRLVRRLALLGAAILALTLAIDLVRIAKYDFAADAVALRADALARGGLPRGETVTDVDRQLDERLARVRGPGLGFSRTAAAMYAAIRATPGTELTALDFQPNGDVRLGVAVEREALATDLKRTLEAAGFVVRAGTFQSTAGRITGELTVSAG